MWWCWEEVRRECVERWLDGCMKRPSADTQRSVYVFRKCAAGAGIFPGYVRISSPANIVMDNSAHTTCRYEQTDKAYGVNETLLASVLGAVVFSFFAAQPLCIVGVTGKYSGMIPG